MNSENFHEYVKNPSMLHQVSYQELKSLVLQYPYSPNLRYLLLLKSLFDQSKDFDKNQVVASLSSPDRKKLRQLVKQYSRLREIQENYSLNEDFLELKDLSSLEDLAQIEEEDIAQQRDPGFVSAAVPPPTVSLIEDLEEEIEAESDLSFIGGFIDLQDGFGLAADETEPPPAETLTEEIGAVSTPEAEPEPLPTLEDLMDQALDESLEISPEAPQEEAKLPDEEVEVPDLNEESVPERPFEAKPATEIPLEITNEQEMMAPPVPRPTKSSFNSWLRQLNPPQAGMLQADLRDISLNSKQLHHTEDEKEETAKQIAHQSVEEDDEIGSETLALLLEKQKHYSKAISMYKRLSLQNPEKSSLFAAKIEELNKKL